MAYSMKSAKMSIAALPTALLACLLTPASLQALRAY